jgi:hypothetical protein
VTLIPNASAFRPDLLREWHVDEPVVVFYLEQGVPLIDGSVMNAKYLVDFSIARATGDLVAFEIDAGSIEIVDDDVVLMRLGFPDAEGFPIARSRYGPTTAEVR